MATRKRIDVGQLACERGLSSGRRPGSATDIADKLCHDIADRWSLRRIKRGVGAGRGLAPSRIVLGGRSRRGLVACDDKFPAGSQVEVAEVERGEVDPVAPRAGGIEANVQFTEGAANGPTPVVQLDASVDGDASNQ